VACGLYLGRRSSSFFSSGVRLQTASTWNTLTFVLDGIAFLLIGLQLPVILHGIRTADRDEVVVSTAWTIAAIIGLRLAWVYPSAFLAKLFRARVLRKENQNPMSSKGLFIVGWTGMRGVVSLAAAFSLPTHLDDGSPLPQRNIILVITFAVIFITVVVQGLSLPPLIRLLNLRSRSTSKDEERSARRLMTEHALQEADRIRSESDEDSAEVIDDLAHWYHHRLSGLEGDEDGDGNGGPASQAVRRREVGRRLRDVERSTLIDLRDESKISDVTLRKLERELDLLDLRFENEF
jgi:CPA1 family monovalent cation:H+ antiporter